MRQVLLLEMPHDHIHALLPVIPRHHQMPELIYRAVQIHASIGSPGQGVGCHLGGAFLEAHVIQGPVGLGPSNLVRALDGLRPGPYPD